MRRGFDFMLYVTYNIEDAVKVWKPICGDFVSPNFLIIEIMFIQEMKLLVKKLYLPSLNPFIINSHS